jgi:1-acyl-sn-glycerol-3-phosphate acyltransferase
MRFIRSLLLLLYLIVYTVPYAIACFIAFPFLRADRRYWMAAGWCKSTIVVLRHLNGIRYTIEGWENLPDGPAVLLSKHQSAWETLAFPALMPRPLCYVFKRELLFVPFFGWALGLLKMVHIDRKQGKDAFASVTRQGRARMDEGAWVIMFPEGTRTRVGSQGKYKTGGARFAVATGAPVVPIAHNAGRVWPRHSFLKYAGIVTVSIGKPIATTGLTPEEVNQRVETWIEAEMRRIDPAAYSSTDAGSTHAPRASAGR